MRQPYDGKPNDQCLEACLVFVTDAEEEGLCDDKSPADILFLTIATYFRSVAQKTIGRVNRVAHIKSNRDPSQRSDLDDLGLLRSIGWLPNL